MVPQERLMVLEEVANWDAALSLQPRGVGVLRFIERVALLQQQEEAPRRQEQPR
jgi:hypothetical protein